MIEIFNVVCDKCSETVKLEVSVGTHKVRVLPRDPGTRLSTNHDSSGSVWVSVLCPECRDKK